MSAYSLLFASCLNCASSQQSTMTLEMTLEIALANKAKLHNRVMTHYL
jgi:hypothetical protein